MSNDKSKITTDHKIIKDWVTKRGGFPATVKTSEYDDEIGILRIEFNKNDERLIPIDWEDFFKKFEEKKLAFLYQEITADNKESRFFKFVSRD